MSSLLLVIFTWKNDKLFKSYIIEFLEQDMGFMVKTLFVFVENGKFDI